MRVAVLSVIILATPVSAAEINISQYVFRDLNRNGVYDLGESPYAGLAVRLVQAGQEPVIRESNLSGFANFVMSADDEGDITGPGPLEFTMLPPDGMTLTSGNPVQTSTARLLEGSPGGIVIDPPLPFVGIAPVLTIETGAENVETMTCEAPNGAQVDATRRAASGALACVVSLGDWTVEWTAADGTTARRSVTVSEWPLRVPLPISGTVTEGEVVTARFDDIVSSENIQEVPAGHGGMRWHNFVAAHRKFYEGWGYVNGTASGQFSAYNSSGHPARIHSDTPFDFLGATISVAWPKGMHEPIRVEAIRDGAVVASDEFLGSNMRPLRFDPGWNGIDEVRISHETYWQVVIDDVTVRR